MTNKKAPAWEHCENEKRQQYSEKGCKVVPTGKGSDFLAICPDQKPLLVEVKDGCHGLTELQKKTMNQANSNGWEYRTERCGCPKSVRSHS